MKARRGAFSSLLLVGALAALGGAAAGAVLRPRPPVSNRDLLPRRHAAPPRGGIEAASRPALRPSDRDRDRGGDHVLPGRGVPSALPREESRALQVLSLELRPRRAL